MMAPLGNQEQKTKSLIAARLCFVDWRHPTLPEEKLGTDTVAGCLKDWLIISGNCVTLKEHESSEVKPINLYYAATTDDLRVVA